MPGEGDCVGCGDELPLSELLRTEEGPICDNCEPAPAEALRTPLGQWCASGMLGLATTALVGGTVALPWLTDVATPGLIETVAALALLFGPVLGPSALLKGWFDLRWLRFLADAAAPGVVPGFWVSRFLGVINVIAGASLGLLSCVGWGYLLVGPVP